MITTLEYRLVITEPEATNCFSIISVLKKFYLLIQLRHARDYFMDITKLLEDVLLLVDCKTTQDVIGLHKQKEYCSCFVL